MARDSLAIGTLLSGQRAGHFTLPTELEQAIGRAARVSTLRHDAAARAAAVSPGQTRAMVLAEITDAVLAGQPVDESLADRIVAAEQLAQRNAFLLAAYASASEQAEADLAETYRDLADTILVDHLRPAQEQTLDEVREVAPALVDLALPMTAEAVLAAPERQRKAYSALLGLHARYAALRQVYWLVAGTARDDALTEVRNWRALFVVDGADNWLAHLQTGWQPDPRGALDRLIWLATSAAEPWMPTPAEVDAAFVELREFTPDGHLPENAGLVPA